LTNQSFALVEKHLINKRIFIGVRYSTNQHDRFLPPCLSSPWT